MKDIRDYRSAIVEAVARERKNDKNWSWRIKSVTKDVAKIGWGYLDYVGVTEFFELRLYEEEADGANAVIGTMPNGWKVYVLVGPKRWDDCPTYEGAIKIAIHSMASSAHETY